MDRTPVSRNVDPTADPDAVMLQDVVQRRAQRAGARRTAGQAGMEADRHKSRRLGALFVKLVEGRFEIGLEIRWRAEPGGEREFSVIGVHCVGDDEVRLAGDVDPIGQFVVVGVRIVKKAALLDQETAGVFARPVAAVPTERPLADRALDRFDRAGDSLALLVLAQAEMLFPLPPVAADVIAGSGNRLGDPRISLERDRAAKYGQGDSALREETEQTPHADPASKLVHRLEGKITPARGDAAPWRFRQSKFGAPVAVGNRVFRSLLIIDSELHCDPSPSRPACVRALVSVANEIPNRPDRPRRGHGSRSSFEPSEPSAMARTLRVLCNSAKISARCWSTRGPAKRIDPGVRERRGKTFCMRTGPRSSSCTVTIDSRARYCGSRKICSMS